MDYQALHDELVNDPLARGYAGMTDEQAAADLNTVYRTRNRSSMSGDEVYNATDPTEFSGLADVPKQLWMAFCGRTGIDPFATANVETAIQIFGNTSQTVTNLQALRVEDVSRAVELGLGEVKVGHIEQARAQYGGI